MINSIVRKVILLLCIVFAVVAFGFPCFVVPFGSYDGEILTYADGKEHIENKYSYSFGLNGKVKYVLTSAENEAEIIEQKEYYYKLVRNKIFISEDEQFGNEDDRMMTIASIIRLGDGSFNIYSCAMAIGVAVVAGALILTAPNRRY